VNKIGDDPLDAVIPDGLDVAVYVEIAAPPLLALPVNVRLTLLTPPVSFVAVPIVGALGVVVAVIEFDAADEGPVPAAFVPVTVNV
jgi:hypothetical protein